MRNCCHKYCKSIKNAKNDKQNPIGINEPTYDFSKSFDIREKRIGIVFKVMYVIAALFASTFMLVSKEFGKGLSTAYIVYICFTVFTMMLLYRMIVYILNELKCLKTNCEALSDKDRDAFGKQTIIAEKSYMCIFNYFSVGGVISILSGIVLFSSQLFVNKQILLIVSFVTILFGSVTGNMPHKKHNIIWQSVSSSMWTISFISNLAIMAF